MTIRNGVLPGLGWAQGMEDAWLEEEMVRTGQLTHQPEPWRTPALNYPQGHVIPTGGAAQFSEDQEASSGPNDNDSSKAIINGV